MINRILTLVICIILLCATVILFGTPEQNETMGRIFGKTTDLLSVFKNTSIVLIMIGVLIGSAFGLWATVKLRKGKEIKFERYVIFSNLFAILGMTSLGFLLYITINGMPSLGVCLLLILGIFCLVALGFKSKMIIELGALECLVVVDQLTKEVRVFFGGFTLGPIFGKIEKGGYIDMRSSIDAEIEEDFPTKDPGTLIHAKGSVITKPKFGDENTPEAVKAEKALEYIRVKDVIYTEQKVFGKKTMGNYFKTHSLNQGSTAKSDDIFPAGTFDYLSDKFPVELSEATVFDNQPTAASLEQQAKIQAAKNQRKNIAILRGKNKKLSEESANETALILDGKLKKTINQEQKTFKIDQGTGEILKDIVKIIKE